ncbi:uncharacterized protein PHACADRAFT_209976 [Phanerochaete carnosa HHB-10118-sp]|uniref:F-box domain-containing protein n=1 Tax=Phanerochaete carnosa (strain HHB-10118-sp) TaxID=650164 RepID=K5VRM4_PHACS|nr:uncharacterized protein PHACADRAFT_209976 [Phanerochaete carnosa HHB-10118-sp]EKM54158.1 hypothetical protein PHACADRAFT_209976 [Phanerochaete carnosa HHB-10118-sp]
MHACLQVSDIQYLIFSLCEGISSRGTLAALARTCSQFYGPVMDALWYSIDGFSPLLHSLPPHLFAVRSRPCIWSEYVEERELYFAKGPSPEDWVAFFKHAHRIRDLTIGLTTPNLCMATTYSKTIFPVILEQMRLRLTDPSHPPIFPNLLTVRCQWRSTLGIVSDYIPRLFNSRLRTVWISTDAQGPREVEKYNDFLSSMKAGYDNVEILSVLSGFSTKDVFGSGSPQLSEYIASLHALRVFRSNVLIDEAAVRHLSLSRHLTNLSCRIPELPESSRPVSTLDSLREVSLYGPNMESCTSFLRAIRTPSLDSLELQFNAPCTTAAVHSCLEVVAASTSLRYLRLWADRVAYTFYQPRPCTITSRTLSLLYDLSELTELHVEEHIQLDLCDDDALEMAEAWPSMQKLVFMACSGTDEHQGHPRLTTRALLHVAKHWPDLYQLGLSFDASDSNRERLASLKTDEFGRCLRTLEVHPPLSYVDDARGVALFLCNLFPNLQAVRFSDTDLAHALLLCNLFADLQDVRFCDTNHAIAHG